MPSPHHAGRAGDAHGAPDIFAHYDSKLQEFLDFVLSQYVKEGVEDLEQEKLGKLLELKYHNINDAAAALGGVPIIRDTFIGFQQYLYEQPGLAPKVSAGFPAGGAALRQALHFLTRVAYHRPLCGFGAPRVLPQAISRNVVVPTCPPCALRANHLAPKVTRDGTLLIEFQINPAISFDNSC